MTVDAKPVPIQTDDTADREFVKGLGLTSSTMLVMGSMIGSGIFLVSAEIAREVDSPALLIAAWLVTGFMTITAALAYGELAAMMPRAWDTRAGVLRSQAFTVCLTHSVDGTTSQSA